MFGLTLFVLFSNEFLFDCLKLIFNFLILLWLNTKTNHQIIYIRLISLIFLLLIITVN